MSSELRKGPFPWITNLPVYAIVRVPVQLPRCREQSRSSGGPTWEHTTLPNWLKEAFDCLNQSGRVDFTLIGCSADVAHRPALQASPGLFPGLILSRKLSTPLTIRLVSVWRDLSFISCNSFFSSGLRPSGPSGKSMLLHINLVLWAPSSGPCVK